MFEEACKSIDDKLDHNAAKAGDDLRKFVNQGLLL